MLTDRTSSTVVDNILPETWPVEAFLNDFKNTIDKYLVEEEMVYVIVGDKETQLAQVNRIGQGNAVELDIYGTPK